MRGRTSPGDTEDRSSPPGAMLRSQSAKHAAAEALLRGASIPKGDASVAEPEAALPKHMRIIEHPAMIWSWLRPPQNGWMQAIRWRKHLFQRIRTNSWRQGKRYEHATCNLPYMPCGGGYACRQRHCGTCTTVQSKSSHPNLDVGRPFTA